MYNNFIYKQRQEILDFFGKILIEHVRDRSLDMSINIAKSTTPNKMKLDQYSALSKLTPEQKEAVCDLLSESITDTIFNFLDMFEANADKMKIIVLKDDTEYDFNKVSEKMGGEISFPDEDGWIQKFSKIGRFVM